MPKKIPLTFEQARTNAELYMRHKERLCLLLEKATRKAERHYESLLGPCESFQMFIRLIRCWVAGKYSASAPLILTAVATVIYFVSPFDLLPDATPFLGLVDDALVITSVARANLRAISRFRNWEISSR